MNSAAVTARRSQIIVTFTPPQLKTPAMVLQTAWCYMKEGGGGRKKEGKKKKKKNPWVILQLLLSSFTKLA